MNKCRPILVLLNSTADVRNILSKCHSLSSPVSIKPDRSTTERRIEAILLKERWKLIQLGMDRCSIRLRNSAIYVNSRLNGRVTVSVFMPTPTLGDLAPRLSTLPVSSSTPTQLHLPIMKSLLLLLLPSSQVLIPPQSQLPPRT